MCRQGGYYDQAVFLAKKNGEHELVVDILIEDSKDYENALDYIWRLEPDMAYPNLMKYARVLLEHCPKDATQVFIDYYTGEYRPKKDAPLPAQPVPQGGAINAVQNLASFIPLPYRQSPAVVSPAPAGDNQVTLQEADLAAIEAVGPLRDYDLPRPRTAFSSFVDHPDNFITFLEACLRQETIEESDKIDLYTTLFEIYLETANTKKGAEKEDWEAKAKRLISGQDVGFFMFLCWFSKLMICFRRQSTNPTCFYSPTYLTSATVQFWFESNKVSVSTSSDHTPPPTIPQVPSKP